MAHIVDNTTVEQLATLQTLRFTPTVQATAAVTTTLTVSSPTMWIFTGTTAGQIFKLPSGTTLQNGYHFIVYNNSTQTIAVQDNSAGALFTIPAGACASIYLQSNATIAGIWVSSLLVQVSTASAGSAGNVQFRGTTAGTFAASTLFTWDTTTSSLTIGPTGVVLPDNPLSVNANVNSYAQSNVQNINAGSSASSDIVATADNGTDSVHYVDLGINSSTYNDPTFDIVGPNDAYLYANDDNLAIGSKAKDLILFAGGTLVGSEVARASADGYFQQNLGRVHVPNIRATALNNTYILTSLSQSLQVLTGSATGQIVKLPSALTLSVGQIYEIYNQSTQSVILQAGDGTVLTYIPPTAVVFAILQAAGSSGGTWITYGNTIGSASGIVNYKITSTTTFTTASNSDVVITGFTLTPAQGTYAIWYNSSSLQATNGANQNCTVYNGGVAVTDSIRNQRGGAAGITLIMSTMTSASFNGTSACDIRVNTNTGSITVGARTLLLTRLGN